MKNLNVILLLVVVTFICPINCMDGQGRAGNSEKEMLQAAKNTFQMWKQTHGKRYDNETQEDQKFQVWFNNKKKLTTITFVLPKVLKHTQKNCISIMIRR